MAIDNFTVTSSLFMPTVRITTPNLDVFHHTIEVRNSYSYTSLLGFNASSSSTVGKREDFNEENFSKGGLEFTHYYVADEDGDRGILSQTNDWGTIYDQTKCQANKDIKNNHKRDFVKYQIYDNNNKGTIAAGTIVGFTSKPVGFHGINQEPNAVPIDTSCEIK
ncbi:uncharacterized protein PRCAT00003253001 [Priceomyces carsonii]|uniref:uncharacterized protein n=1 Tax=Priceomyces carsonii TaxID=28549 RepID=UPI002ED779FB|nr:unnamed protein product [Priceomyces carsonii]